MSETKAILPITEQVPATNGSTGSSLSTDNESKQTTLNAGSETKGYLFSSESSELSDLDSEAETEKLSYGENNKEFLVNERGEYRSQLMELARRDGMSDGVMKEEETLNSIEDKEQFAEESDDKDIIEEEEEIVESVENEGEKSPSVIPAEVANERVLQENTTANEPIEKVEKVTVDVEPGVSAEKIEVVNGVEVGGTKRKIEEMEIDIKESTEDNKKIKVESIIANGNSKTKDLSAETGGLVDNETPIVENATAIETPVVETNHVSLAHEDEDGAEADDEDHHNDENEEDEVEEGEEDEEERDAEVLEESNQEALKLKQEEDMAKQKFRKEALDKLKDIEIEFARLKDKLYENKLGSFESEIQMCLNGSHPALKPVYERIEEHRNKKLKLVQNRHKYQLLCIDRQIRAQRIAIHQQFIKDKAEVKMKVLNESTTQWYDINRDRKMMNAITPEYSFRVSKDKQEQISHFNEVDHEVGLLDIVNQKFGFPVATRVSSGTKEEIHEDLLKLGIA